MKKKINSEKEAQALANEILSKILSNKHLQKINWIKRTDKKLPNTKPVWFAGVSSDYQSTSHFNWNHDADYCEKQYDCYSIIEKCDLFNETVAYGEKLREEYNEKYGNPIGIVIDGTKNEVTVGVWITINCLTEQPNQPTQKPIRILIDTIKQTTLLIETELENLQQKLQTVNTKIMPRYIGNAKIRLACRGRKPTGGIVIETNGKTIRFSPGWQPQKVAQTIIKETLIEQLSKKTNPA